MAGGGDRRDPLTGAAWILYTDELQEMPFDFGYVRMVDVKGKGPTPARFLLGRS